MTDLVRYGIVIAAAAVVLWAVLLIAMLRREVRHEERRPMMLTMPVVGLIASVGALASAIAGEALLAGREVEYLEALTVIASMGRGALLMGGITALIYLGHPHE